MYPLHTVDFVFCLIVRSQTSMRQIRSIVIESNEVVFS